MVLCMLLTFIMVEFKYFNVQVFLCIIIIIIITIIITIIIIITGRLVSDGHAFHENVLWEDMCNRWACLAGLCRSNHLSCYEFRHLVVVFFFFL